MDLHSPDRVTVPMLRRGAGGVQGGTWRWGVMSRCTGLSTSTEASAPARYEVHHPQTSKRGDVPSDAKASPLPLSVTGHCGGTTGSVAAQKCAVCFIFSAPLLEGLTEVGRIRAHVRWVFSRASTCFFARGLRSSHVDLTCYKRARPFFVLPAVVFRTCDGKF